MTTLKCAYLGSTPQDRGLSLFIALRWMQDPRGVMMWVAENIQACLRIFRQAQHQWLVRDILHPTQGVFPVFVLLPSSKVQEVQEVQGVLAVLAVFVLYKDILVSLGAKHKPDYYCPLNMFLCRIIRFLAKDKPPLKR